MTDDVEKRSSITIGYSAFRLFDECYEYNENACYIADTPESLRVFLTGADFSVNDYETVAITPSDLLDDFGCSNWEYALEPEALSRFEKEAETSGIGFTVTPYEDFLGQQPELFIVHVNTLNQALPDSQSLRVLSETIKDLERYDGVYKRESVNAAIELKDEITPALIDVLEKIIISPNEYAGRNNYHAPVYSAMLLGHFREAKAHTAIVEVFSLHLDILDDLFGDLVYEDLPAILLRTCGGSFDEIKSLAMDRLAWTNSRYAALKSMVLGVMDGVLDQDETLEFFCSLFTGKEAEPQSDFWSLLATCVYELYPENVMETIKNAYDEELIDPDIISLHNFKSALEEQGKEEFLEKYRVEQKRTSMDDIHGRMSWWACFNREMDMPRISSSPKPKRKPKKSKKKKIRKKMRKASKKKNRR
jgi:hypothetical protein